MKLAEIKQRIGDYHEFKNKARLYLPESTLEFGINKSGDLYCTNYPNIKEPEVRILLAYLKEVYE